MKRIVLTLLGVWLAGCGTPSEKSGDPQVNQEARRLEGETLIVQNTGGPTALGVRLEGLKGAAGTPSLLNLSVSSSQLPQAGFGALTCFQGTDHPKERTQVCMGFRHTVDVTAQSSQPELFFFRIERVDGLDRPHIMFSAGQSGLTIYEDNGAWWSGETWDREGQTSGHGHFPKPVASIGSDGVIRAKAFEVIED